MVKHIFKFFSEVRTALLSSIFLSIFSLVGTTFLARNTKFEKRKKLKKELNEELMTVAWHPNRWWDWYMSKDEKKEIDPMFIEEL